MPIFYEIIAPNGQKNYLFGTIHLKDKDINTLSSEVKHAFETASVLYVEVNTSHKDDSFKDWYDKHGHEHSQWVAIPGNVNEITRQIAGHFPWYIDVKSLVKKNPPLHTVSASLYFNIASRSSAKTLDENLVNIAKKRNIIVDYLEDLSSQLNSIYGTELSYQEQRQLFDLFMKKKVTTLDQVKKSYNDANINNTFREEYLGKFEEQHRHLAGRYWDELITKRDEKMAAKLEQPFLFGGAFVAVGAAHLPGIVEIYQKKGYTINEIPITKRIYPVVDYYERNYFSMVYAGIASMLAGACLTAGLLISHQILSIGLLLLATALATCALVKAGFLTYEYITEPTLPINKLLDINRPISPRVSIFNNQLRVTLTNMPTFIGSEWRNKEVQDVLEKLISHSPILLLKNGEENIDRVIGYKYELYLFNEMLNDRITDQKPISQEEFESMLTLPDPRDAYRLGSVATMSN